jgi:hypothetical protein
MLKSLNEDFVDDTIIVDGILRPTRNSEGKLIADTTKEITRFYQWFNDSTLVDKDGRPLVLYYSKVDKANGSIWFVDVPKLSGVTNKLRPTYLKISNPVSKSDEDDLVELINGFETETEYDGIKIKSSSTGINSYVVYSEKQMRSIKLNKVQSFKTFSGV